MRTWKSLSLCLSHPSPHFLSLSFYSVSPLLSLLYHLMILLHWDNLYYILLYKMGFTIPLEIIFNIFNNSCDIGQPKWPPVQHCPVGKNIISTHMLFVTPFFFNNRSCVCFQVNKQNCMVINGNTLCHCMVHHILFNI